MTYSDNKHIVGGTAPSKSDASGVSADALARSTKKLEFTIGSTTLGKDALMKSSLPDDESVDSTNVTATPTERFFNVAELRLQLYETIYETIRVSASGKLNAYSGFLTASSFLYEATFELLKARALYLSFEEQRWSHRLQCAVRMPAPTTLPQLREATVLLLASFFSVDNHSNIPQNYWPALRDLYAPIKGASGKAFAQFPLGQLDVDRLTFSIYEDVANIQIREGVLLDLLLGLRNTMMRIHHIYRLKETCRFEWEGTSVLLPGDCPLKARTITIFLGSIRVLHANQDPCATNWMRLHPHGCQYWSCRMIRGVNGFRAGWEYSRKVMWKYDHPTQDERCFAVGKRI